MSESTKRFNPNKFQKIRLSDVDKEWQQFQREMAFERFMVRLVVAAFLFAGVALALLLWWAVRA